jgi:hypothetical protein
MMCLDNLTAFFFPPYPHQFRPTLTVLFSFIITYTIINQLLNKKERINNNL